MGLFRSLAVAAGVLAAVGCGPRSGPGPTAGVGEGASFASSPDAPYELAEPADLELLRHRFDAMPVGSPDRAAARGALATEYGRRIARSLDRGVDPEAAYETLLSLVSMWTAAELATPPADLAQHAGVIRRVGDYFARGGGDREATAALTALMLADPTRADEYAAEVDEIFAFADDLAVAQYGPGGQRARPIEILEAIVPKLPSRFVVDRLIALYVDRQKAIESKLRRSESPDIATIKAHGTGILHTARKIVGTLALAGRIDEAHRAIETVSGIGDDAKLRRALVAAVAADASASDWISLARQFRSDDDDDDDPATALAVARLGSARLPSSAALYCYLGQLAEALDHVELAIAYFEPCLARAPATFEAADALAGLYQARMGQLVFSDRPGAALEVLEALVAFHKKAAERWPDKKLEHDLAAANATMGRGLVSLGELEGARGYLRASIDQRPDFPALESLGTVALKLGNHEEAARYFDLALRLPSADLNGQYQRAKILRLAAEAHAAAGNTRKAERYGESALIVWRDIATKVRLLDQFQGELHVEVGKLLWQQGNEAEALVEFDKAVDADPDGSSTLTGVVAFLVVRDQRAPALDAYHRALGSFKVSDYFKVYMSLWVLAEARQRGVDPDPLAVQYLAGRKGALWYDQLAGFATGRAELGALERRATTRARRAELMYYTAVLSDAASDPKRARKLLEEVVATEMITFFEYDMARLWLDRGMSALRTSPTAR